VLFFIRINKIKMSIYKISENGIDPINKTSFQEQKILERTHLQSYLRDKIEIISPNTLIISEEFSEWNESKRRIDLLGVDKNANLVVIELKRTESGDHMELQALRYASMISAMSFKKCISVYQKYLDSRNIEMDAKDSLLNFLEWDTLEKDFAVDVKIVLASAGFSKELTTSVMWLIGKNIDITCIKLAPYIFNDELLLNVTQIIPLPEAEDYLIQLKEKAAERQVAIQSSKDTSKYLFRGMTLGKGRLVLEIVKEFVKQNPLLTFLELKEKFPIELQGSTGVINEIEYIDKKYSHTPIKRHFLKEDEILTTHDNNKFAVCSQWGIGNIHSILELAKKEGFEIQVL
jgi:hypothetical protein